MKEWNGEEIKQQIETKSTFCLYLYTPICGTCQVASKMLAVVTEMEPTVEAAKTDVNYIKELAEKFQVESVPCLLIFNKGELEQKIYALQSVPYLLELFRRLKNN